MNRTIITLGMLIIAVVVLSACGQTGQMPVEGREVKLDGGSYRDITPTQLRSMLENKDFLLVNVHIPYAGETPDTDIFIPFNEIEQNLSKFPEDKGAKIILYCRSGGMSATAVRTLVNQEFTNVWNLDGGMMAWEREGYELIRNPQ